MSTTQNPSAGPSNSKQPTNFEFTKRKKYADLLITELAEAIVLVLSSQCKVLFCGSAVTELLGWRDEDLIDGDLIELINSRSQVSLILAYLLMFSPDEDRLNFRCAFDESLNTRDEMLCYIRLRCKSHFSTVGNYNSPPKEVLFEFKGHPHFMDGQNDCKCFFAVAKPYPSRNTAMSVSFCLLFLFCLW